MNKSQLRRLAREHAQGKIPDDEYRRRRRELLDGIVAGEIAIQREAPPPSPAPEAQSPDAAPAARADDQDEKRARPVLLWIIVAAVILGGALVWALLPPEPDIPARASIPEEPVPERQVSEARALVESFAAERDWGEGAVDEFERRWSALSAAERDEAAGEHWFRRLVGTLREEIKTQTALAEFDDSGAASEKVRRLRDLGEFLGIADRLPAGRETSPTAAEDPDASVASADAGSTRTAETAGSEPVPSGPTDGGESAATASDEKASAATRRSGAPAAPAPLDTAATARAGAGWLEEQAADSYTLQLFAVNQLDRVSRLLASHPAAGMHLLAARGVEPRYRIVWGSFDSEEAARDAFTELPPAVREAQPDPFVKSIRDLRADLNGDPGGAASGRATAPPDGPYTLQLFASDSRDNAKRLIAEYPALNLRLHAAGDGGSRYRVLYGRFGSEDAARAAVDRLPGSLLSKAGDPLLKTFADLDQRAAAN